ncbi:hypothetical protein [Rhizobium sp. BG4]|uniref:hypothetical protein n=1 Tax=Rhizobium sp. BG4 TaxID=2613770 RepID=UPI00193CF2C8|nr:hypothetical protein [Rhizobium sp. BG4]QRM45770.1 hypothetical protein F2982_20290 [Rhizobium sp. BG4]
MSAQIFDDLISKLAALEAEIAAINARPFMPDLEIQHFRVRVHKPVADGTVKARPALTKKIKKLADKQKTNTGDHRAKR